MDQTRPQPTRPSRVALFLNDARVTPDFRDALFAACERTGQTPSEFALTASAEKLARRGASFPGVFRAGDQSLDRRYAELCMSIADDFGGADHLDEAERQIVRQAALVQIEAERVQLDVMHGGPVSTDALQRLSAVLDALVASYASQTEGVAA